MKRLVFAGLLLLGSFQPSFSQTACTPEDEEYRVITVNGIRTSVAEATLNRDELRDALGGTHNSQTIRYDLAYNFNVSAMADLIQSAGQSLTDIDRNLFRWLNGVGIVPQAFLDLYSEAIKKQYAVNTPELADHVQKYREAILQGQKTLLVSHSQGNFYANDARAVLQTADPKVPMESFGIYGVAVPSSHVGGAADGLASYITNHRDVIRFVPGSLPTNWTLRDRNATAMDSLSTVAAHNFASTYMSTAYDTRNELLSRIKNKLSLLKDPPAVVRSGPLTATMTWNLGDSDVDLHVYEPSGAHVYYGSMNGASGGLDLDNTIGYGPEHYYTECNQLQTGEYRIAVNYFADDLQTSQNMAARSTEATIIVSVPGASKIIKRVLSNANYGREDQSPIPVARVIIEKIVDPNNPNRNGLLSYRIVEN